MLHQDWQNYFLCRAEKAWGGTREGTDAVLKVFTASRTGRWYAAVLGIRFGIGTIGREPGKMFFLPKQLHLCWLESVGLDAITVWTEGTYIHFTQTLPCHMAGSMLEAYLANTYLANTDDRSYQTIWSQAQLKVHSNGVFFLSPLTAMSLSHARSCTTWRMGKVGKNPICSASLALTILIRFFYSSPFSVFSELTCS